MSENIPTVRVFFSSLAVDKDVKQRQHRILQTLEVKKIPFEKKDIATSEADKREFKRLMRGYDGRPGPPQIFSGDHLCGDYEAFYWAVEEEKLKVFLRLEAPPKAVAPAPPPTNQLLPQPMLATDADRIQQNGTTTTPKTTTPVASQRSGDEASTSNATETTAENDSSVEVPLPVVDELKTDNITGADNQETTTEESTGSVPAAAAAPPPPPPPPASLPPPPPPPPALAPVLPPTTRSVHNAAAAAAIIQPKTAAIKAAVKSRH